jgi:hypothetical protein
MHEAFQHRATSRAIRRLARNGCRVLQKGVGCGSYPSRVLKCRNSTPNSQRIVHLRPRNLRAEPFSGVLRNLRYQTETSSRGSNSNSRTVIPRSASTGAFRSGLARRMLHMPKSCFRLWGVGTSRAAMSHQLMAKFLLLLATTSPSIIPFGRHRTFVWQLGSKSSSTHSQLGNGGCGQ